MATNSYYSLLGISSNATTEQVRTRFLELARTLHPDRFQGREKEEAEERFQQLTEAFNVLSNPMRRREHDEELARGEAKDSGPDLQQLVKVYMQRGVQAYREQNYSAAADNFQRAARTDPANGRAWYHIALACSHQDRWLSQAVSAIERACQLEAMNGKYLKLAGHLFEKAGKVAEAERYYTQALKWGGEDEAVQGALDRLQKSKKGKSSFFGKAT